MAKNQKNQGFAAIRDVVSSSRFRESRMKGNHTAILFASNGVTSDAQEEIYRLVMSNIFIICVTANDVKRLHSSSDCKELILNKWMDLQEKQDISGMI